MSGAAPPQRDLVLLGTGEPLPRRDRLAAGRLSMDLEAGVLRHLRWDGLEVLRGIAFVLRDTSWGTYRSDPEDLRIEADDGGFAVSFEAGCDGAEGDFRFAAHILGSADGRLSFRARGRSDGGFRTNRTGFVVLHDLAGTVGRPVEVEHATGGRTTAAFPADVAPRQPLRDIRALTHRPREGLWVAVRMTGDTFEMEDQRNWTDASFKTYVRPLARGFPYVIAAGEVIAQSVEVVVSDSAGPVPRRRPAARRATLGADAGRMPQVGLAVAPGDLDLLGDGRVPRPNYVVVRADLSKPPDLDPVRLAEVCGSLGIGVDFDVVAPGGDAVAAFARTLRAAAVRSSRVLVMARDGARVPDLIRAARSALPGVPVGAGTVFGFAELNRDRPSAGVDFVAHSTQAIVHAADDTSVMETLEALPHLIRTARGFAPGAALRIGPATIGAPAAFYAATARPNPARGRVPAAERDPRQDGLFGAAFALGYLAAAARSGVEALTLGACTGACGVRGPAGPRPVASVVKAAAAMAGHPRLSVETAGEGFCAVAARTERGVEMWLANLTGKAMEVSVDGAPFRASCRMDVASGGARTAFAPWSGATVTLDAYAVHGLREREGGR